MDMNHQFLHRKQMGQMRPRFFGAVPAARIGWRRNTAFPAPAAGGPLGEAAIFRPRHTGGIEAAERDIMTIRTRTFTQTLRICTNDETPVIDLWIAYVPLDREQRTNQTFGLLSIKRPRIPGLLDAAWPLLVLFTERIFKEDREIVELEQAAHDLQGEDRNQEVFPVIRNVPRATEACGIPERRVVIP